MSATPELPSPYMTVEQVAELAHCEHKAVRRAIAQGQLQAFRPVKQIVIRSSDAVAWIEERPARQLSSRRPRSSRRRSPPGSVQAIRELERQAR